MSQKSHNLNGITKEIPTWTDKWIQMATQTTKPEKDWDVRDDVGKLIRKYIGPLCIKEWGIEAIIAFERKTYECNHRFNQDALIQNLSALRNRYQEDYTDIGWYDFVFSYDWLYYPTNYIIYADDYESDGYGEGGGWPVDYNLPPPVYDNEWAEDYSDIMWMTEACNPPAIIE